MAFGVSTPTGLESYGAKSTQAYEQINAEIKPTGGSMDWLAALGVVAGPVAGIVDAFTGTGTAKANASQAASNAQIAQYAAQVEQERVQAEGNTQLAMYGLIAVGVLVGGFILYKVL